MVVRLPLELKWWKCTIVYVSVYLTHWGRGKVAAIFQTTLLNEFSWMKMYKFRLRFHWSLFPQINNIPALVQIMAWRRPGVKPLSEPMMVNLLRHLCVTRPQWVNSMRPSDAYMRLYNIPTLVQIMACHRHYLNQCCHIVNYTVRSIFQWNFIQNSQGNALNGHGGLWAHCFSRDDANATLTKQSWFPFLNLVLFL